MSPTVAPAAAAPGELEEELGAACARARAAWPHIPLDDRAFARHLGRVVARSEGTAAPGVGSLVVEDLYLACACAAQVSGAAVELETRYGAAIRASIARIVASSDAAEVEQQLLKELLFGSEGAADASERLPKIASYSGQAPLGRWLQVSAQRAALMSLRSGRAERRARAGAAAEAAAPGTHPEIKYLKQRYRGDFEDALKNALGRVADRQRVLLRLHLVNGVSVERIGKMFGVSQSTASRWLAEAREALVDDVKQALKGRLGVSPEEVASLGALLASGIDLSLSQLLRTR